MKEVYESLEVSVVNFGVEDTILLDSGLGDNDKPVDPDWGDGDLG